MKLYNFLPHLVEDRPQLHELTEADFIYSYDRDFSNWTSESARIDIWAISMPSGSSANNGPARQWYVLGQLLDGRSVSDGLRGRESMVWKAIKLGDQKREVCLYPNFVFGSFYVN